VGDVLLTGPAVRAVAASGEPVTFLGGPKGADAAALLPGVGEVITFDAPWIAYDSAPVDAHAIDSLLDGIRSRGIDEAVILTSFHQSPLPLALLLRIAGVGRIVATSVDYPGSLLDLRHPYREELHEVEQALSLCAAAGYVLPADDDGRLRLDLAIAPGCGHDEPYVVVHPGASVGARALPPAPAAEAVELLVGVGYHVVITGSAAERELARAVASRVPPRAATVRCGTTDLSELAAIIAEAEAVVCGNTGVAHIAAAVGTPVVEAFAPVVPAHRWRPWRVPHVLLGALDVPCAGCRARECPIVGQPCLEPFSADAVAGAVATLTAPCDSRRYASIGVHP
jgi:ADP-heptose:LPS heptosyltransferase